MTSVRTPGPRTGPAFELARSEGRAALVGYLPAGFPDVPGAIEALRTMVDSGCDVIEIGLPYSDPVMDGPTIQDAAQLALEGGFRASDVIRTVEAVAATGTPHVEIDDLGACRQPRADVDLEKAVVEARPRMQHHNRRSLAHPGAVRHQLCAVHVDIKAHAADRYPHGATLLSPGIRQRNWSQRHDRESTGDRRWARRVGRGRPPA